MSKNLDNLFRKKILFLVLQKPNQTYLVFEKEKILNQLGILKTNKPANVKILFPIKSFPTNQMVQFLNPLVDGFEISNLNEYILLQGVTPHREIFLTNCFNYENLLIDPSVIVNIGSLEQLKILKGNFSNKISLRIQPPDSLEQGKLSRFGLNDQELEHILLDQKILEKVEYLHFHLGFEKTKLEDIKTSLLKMLDIQKKHFPNVHTFNLGGGITKLSPQDVQSLYKTLAKYNFQFLLEPGRFLFEHAGHAIGKVTAVKERQDQILIEVNLSKECHLKWSSPKNISLMNLENNEDNHEEQLSDQSKPLRIFGSTCFEGDHILDSLLTQRSPIRPGTFLLFDNVSGYSVAWNHEFNGIPKAEVILL